MSNDQSTNAGDTATATTTDDSIGTTTTPAKAASTSKSQAAVAIQSLSSILPSISISSITSLHDPDISSKISSLLKQPDSGAGDNNLCRWLYDTFQSSDLDLQLVVLSFVPLVAGLYLSRIPLRIPLAGFEAILLAVYAHETASRGGHPHTVNVPDLSHPSLYHDAPKSANNATGLNLAVISPTLEPHGTVRSTRRARIVAVALELYYTKIYEMSVESKLDFCDFCMVWAGMAIDADHGKEENRGMGRVSLPCELLQPVLRILGHCLLCPNQNNKVTDKASQACNRLYARSMHDINPKAILATGSLLKLANTKPADPFDPTDVPKSRVISL